MQIPIHWPASWQNYLLKLPQAARDSLLDILLLIEKEVPEAEKDWAYQMPAFKYKGKPLVYAAGYTKHTGVYALPNTHAAFAEALKPYKQGKGSVQFPHQKPLPLALIRAMIAFRKSTL
ncbi:MAG: hypothetical protein C0424_11445 [Sphingobacteriaceae bacterium]|nr:hypothetical protein [Sphingobacteriaceae bacterium]